MNSIHRVPLTILAALLAGSLALSGCKSNETKPDEPAQPAKQAEASTPEPEKASAPEKPICKEEPKTSSKKSKKSKTVKKAQPTDCIPASEAAAQAAQEPAANGTYNLSKNKPVTDSDKVEAGQGTMVKGINDWEGEITGLPAKGSKFAKLKIGMTREQAYSILGEPTDQGAYVTGKAWIPFYFGSDKVRWEAVYKGYGRLIFSQQAGWASGSFYLTWIIHNANEKGYR